MSVRVSDENKFPSASSVSPVIGSFPGAVVGKRRQFLQLFQDSETFACLGRSLNFCVRIASQRLRIPQLRHPSSNFPVMKHSRSLEKTDLVEYSCCLVMYETQ